MAFEGLNEKSWTEGDTLLLTNPGPGPSVRGKPVVADGFNAVFLAGGVAAGERGPARLKTTETIPVQNLSNAAIAPGAIIRWNAGKTAYGVDGQGPNGATFNGKVLGRCISALAASKTSRVWVKFLQLAD